MENEKGFMVKKIDQLNLKSHFCVRFHEPKGRNEPVMSAPKEGTEQHTQTEIAARIFESSAPGSALMKSPEPTS